LLLLIPGPAVTLGGFDLPVFDLVGLAALAVVLVLNFGHGRAA
jgi:hypothetical protein